MSELFGEEVDRRQLKKRDADNRKNSLDSQEDTGKESEAKNGKVKDQKIAQVVVEDCESAGSLHEED